MGTQYAFRESFKPMVKETLKWYPGHMDKSFSKMQSKIKLVDCVVEVHDARIPLSGRNPNFVNKLIGPKPHILVLNKKDLVAPTVLTKTIDKLKEEIETIIFTNAKHQMCRGMRQIVPKAVNLIENSNRFNRSEDRNLRIMVIGVPNVGKSSVINALRNINLHKGKATAVGAIAGVTRAVQTDIKVSQNPPMYLVDTPGILPPNIKDDITGLKLALCSCLNDNVVSYAQMADFLLYWCNKYCLFSYVEFFGLSEPCDDIMKVLSAIAKRENKVRQARDVTTNEKTIVLDLNAAAAIMVRSFREGRLGLFSFDFPNAETAS